MSVNQALINSQVRINESRKIRVAEIKANAGDEEDEYESDESAFIRNGEYSQIDTTHAINKHEKTTQNKSLVEVIVRIKNNLDTLVTITLAKALKVSISRRYTKYQQRILDILPDRGITRSLEMAIHTKNTDYQKIIEHLLDSIKESTKEPEKITDLLDSIKNPTEKPDYQKIIQTILPNKKISPDSTIIKIITDYQKTIQYILANGGIEALNIALKIAIFAENTEYQKIIQDRIAERQKDVKHVDVDTLFNKVIKLINKNPKNTFEIETEYEEINEMLRRFVRLDLPVISLLLLGAINDNILRLAELKKIVGSALGTKGGGTKRIRPKRKNTRKRIKRTHG